METESERIIKRVEISNILREKYPEIICVLTYFILHIFISWFHEGCFDETHAWNIARDGTLYEIVFQVTHLEGHPSLWYLVLYPFVHLGVGYKMGMLIVTTFFSTLSVVIFEFRAPFPRMARLLLPFTYFFFYQYGVIARPYCMMVTAVLLVSVFYAQRDEKPVRYVLSLAFLSATSAFGMAIVGGMAVVWIIKAAKKRFFFPRIAVALSLLFLYAIFFFYRVLFLYPFEEVNYSGIRGGGITTRIIYLTTGLFSDLFFTNAYTNDNLVDFEFDNYELFATCILGLAILIVILIIGKKLKTLSEFLVPYILLTVFSTIVYFCVHNSGILLLLIVYWGWITIDKYHESIKNRDYNQKADGCKYTNIVIISLMIIPLIWSVSAGVTDVRYSYSFGEKEAEYLIDNDLEHASILFDWKIAPKVLKGESLEDYNLKYNINMERLYTYLYNPNFINWPFDYSLSVFIHSLPTEEESRGIIKNIRNNPLPDVLIGNPDLTQINGKGFILSQYYEKGYTDRVVKPWKSYNSSYTSEIWVRKDIEK